MRKIALLLLVMALFFSACSKKSDEYTSPDKKGSQGKASINESRVEESEAPSLGPVSNVQRKAPQQMIIDYANSLWEEKLEAATTKTYEHLTGNIQKYKWIDLDDFVDKDLFSALLMISAPQHPSPRFNYINADVTIDQLLLER